MKELIESKSLQDYCRICFQSSSDLDSCFTKLIIENFSFSIIEMLNLISPELKNNKHVHLFPSRICSDCKEIVVTLLHFKIKYEKTAHLLDRLFKAYEKEKVITKKNTSQLSKKNECIPHVKKTKQENTEHVKILVPEHQQGKSDSIRNRLDEESKKNECILHVKKTKQENTEHVKILVPEHQQGKSDSIRNRLDEESKKNECIPHVKKTKQENTEHVKILVPEHQQGKSPLSKEDKRSPHVENCIQNVENTESLETLLPEKQNAISDRIRNGSDEEEERIILVIEPLNNTAENTSEEKNLVLEVSTGDLEIGKFKEIENQNQINESGIKHMCPLCRSELSNANELRKHAGSHRVLKKYLKGRRIPDKARFVARPRNMNPIFHRQNKIFPCSFCTKQLSLDEFLPHIINHLNQKEFTCVKCNRIFRKLNHLRAHINSHLTTLPYQCVVCDKGFMSKMNYDCHMLHHTRPNNLPYKCDKCDKSYANKKHLYHHSFIHTDEGSFWVYRANRCKLCLRTFKTAEELQEHTLEKHDEQKVVKRKKQDRYKIIINADGLFVCRFCSEIYDNESDIKKHIRHTHRKRTLCSECGAKVLYLKQHMLIHQQKKTLECDICHTKLSSKIALSKHIRMHSAKRRFQCTYCGKAYKERNTLAIHERAHIGDKKYVCDICKKGFLEKTYLVKHFKIAHNNKA